MKAQELELWLQEDVDLTENPEIIIMDADGNGFPIMRTGGERDGFVTLHIDTPKFVPELDA